jgi:L-ascorbate metabolism protein UlaG (beta-lactamase superfamily)
MKRYSGTLLFSMIIILSFNSSCIVKSNPTLKVTYIANEGFMIEFSDNKILIDALFKESSRRAGAYTVPSDQLREKMETAKSPFNDLDLILATHNHWDHFNPRSVIRCLKHNPKSFFISTPQAIDDMKKEGEEFQRIREQVKSIDLDWLLSTDVKVNDIELRVIRTHHSAHHTEVQNQVYLIDLGGKKIFHEGDSDGRIETYQQLNLKDEEIDIAFIHDWFLWEPKGQTILKEYIRPKHIILMHTFKSQKDYVKNKVNELKEIFPETTFFKASMEYKIFN